LTTYQHSTKRLDFGHLIKWIKLWTHSVTDTHSVLMAIFSRWTWVSWIKLWIGQNLAQQHNWGREGFAATMSLNLSVWVPSTPHYWDRPLTLISTSEETKLGMLTHVGRTRFICQSYFQSQGQTLDMSNFFLTLICYGTQLPNCAWWKTRLRKIL